MASDKIVLGALLDLGIDKDQLKGIQKLLESSLKADIAFDFKKLEQSAKRGGLVLTDEDRRLLDGLTSGKVARGMGLDESIDRALGRMQRIAERNRELYQDLNRLQRAMADYDAGRTQELKGAAKASSLDRQDKMGAAVESDLAAVRQAMTKLDQTLRAASSPANQAAAARAQAQANAAEAKKAAKETERRDERIRQQEADARLRTEAAQARSARGAGLAGRTIGDMDKDDLKELQTFLRSNMDIARSTARTRQKEFGVGSAEASQAVGEFTQLARNLRDVNAELRTRKDQEKDARSEDVRAGIRRKMAENAIKDQERIEDRARQTSAKLAEIYGREAEAREASEEVRAGIRRKMAENAVKDQERIEDRARKNSEKLADIYGKEAEAREASLRKAADAQMRVTAAQAQSPRGAGLAGRAIGGMDKEDLKDLQTFLRSSLSIARSAARTRQAEFGVGSAEAGKAVEEFNQLARNLRDVNSELRTRKDQEKEARSEEVKAGIRRKMAENAVKDQERIEDRARQTSAKLAEIYGREAEAREASLRRVEEARQTQERKMREAELRYPGGRAAFEGISGIQSTAEARAGRDYAQAGRQAAGENLKVLEKEFGAQSVQVAKARQELLAYNAALGQLKTKLGEVQTAAGGVGRGFSSILTTFSRYALGYGALYEVLQGAGALVRNVVQLDEDMKAIQAVSLSTTTQMNELANSIERVALSTKFSNEEIATSVRTLVQAGVAAEDLDSVISATANFASATNSSLSVAADLISTSRQIFSDLDDNTIANQLTKAVNISKLQAEDLQTILSLGAQVAGSYKISSDQFLAAVTTLRNAGIKPSTVATGLRQAMLEVFSPDQKTMDLLIKRYAALGEDMSTEAIRSRFLAFQSDESPLASAIGELRRLGFAGEARQDFARVFDVRAYNPLLALVQQYDELIANEAKITFGAPAVEAAAIQMEALTAKLENLGGAIVSLSAEMSGGLVKSIGEAVDAATSGVEEISRARAERVSGVDSGMDTSFFARAIDYSFEVNKQIFNGLTTPLGQEFIRRGFESDEETAARQKAGRVEAQAARASATSEILGDVQARIQEFTDAANVFNVEAAKAGEAVGKSAEHILKAQDAMKDMEKQATDLFGDALPETMERVSELSGIYQDLSAAQREAKFEDLKKNFPELENIQFQDFDTQMTQMSSQVVRANALLKGLSEDTLQTIIRQNDIVAKARTKAEKDLTALDVSAIELQRQFETDPAFRAALEGEGTTTERLQAVADAQQRVADGVLAFMDRVVQQSVDRLRGAAFQENILLAFESAEGPEAAQLQAKAALTSMFAQIDGVTDQAIDRIRNLRLAIEKTARVLESRGQTKEAEALRELSELPGQEAKARRQTALQQERDRIGAAQREIVPVFRDPKFQQFLDEGKVGLSKPDLDIVEKFRKNLDGLVTAASANTREFQRMKEIQEIFTTSERRRLKGEEALNRALESRASIEEQISAKQKQISTAEQGKDFSSLPGLRKEYEALRRKQLMTQREELEKQLKSDPTSSNAKGLEDRIGRLTRDIEKLSAETFEANEKMTRERLKVERETQKRTLELLNQQMSDDLDSAIQLLDLEKVDEFAAAIDQRNQRLLKLYEEELRSQMDNEELIKAEVAAKAEELKLIEDQVQFREKIYQAERAERDRRRAELDRQAPNQGDGRQAAFMRKYGYVDREQQGQFAVQAADQELRNVAELEGTKRDLEEIIQNQRQLKAEGSNLFDINQLAAAEQQLDEVNGELHESKILLADLRLEAEGFGEEELEFFSLDAWEKGWQKAKQMFSDTMTHVRYGLQDSQYTFDNITQNMADGYVNAAEGMGDAFANEFLNTQKEGQSFTDEMRDILSQLSDDLIRTAIKTVTNAMIQQFFTMLMSFMGGGVSPSTGIPNPTAGGAVGSNYDIFGMAKTGGIVRAATGGIIRGPGTGTSDSVPGFIVGKGGKKQPLLVSNGEAILTAKATQALGDDFIHAANSGSLFRMAEGTQVSPGTESTTPVEKLEQSQKKAAGQVAQSLQQAPMAVNIYNNIDAGDFFQTGAETPGGSKAVQNIVRKDKNTFKAILNN